MKVNIQRREALRFEAENNNGNRITIDGGDSKTGMRPMELLLTAMGSCSAFDAVLILEKQRQIIDAFSVEVIGQRPDEGFPKPYESIHLIFSLRGTIDSEKAYRAVQLAVEKYCSVSATFRPETKISFEVQIDKTS